MNKRKIVNLVVGALFLTFLSSCLKSGTCECTTVDRSGVLDTYTNTHFLKERKNNLEKTCKGYEVILDSLETTCELR